MAVALTYPGARWTPLGAETESRMTSHDIICAHTMVGFLVSTDRYFRISNGEGYWGTESHFGVGGKWGPDLGGGLDGAVWQWQDLAYGADANLDGKPRVISFETADNAPASADDIEPWTPAQLDAIVDLCDWLCSPEAHAKCPASWQCHQEGIPRALIPDSKPGRRGLGYHAQGAAERVPGGEEWSTSPGKVCPAARRIAQFKTIVVPRVAARGGGEEDLMPEPADLWNYPIKNPDSDHTMTAAARLLDIETRVGALGADVERRVRAAISQLLGGTVQRVVDLKQMVADLSSVTGDDEVKILAELDAVRDEVLAAVTPDPTQPASAPAASAGAASDAEA